MSSSTTERSASQNNRKLPSSNRTSTAPCAPLTQAPCMVALIPAHSLFQWPSLTRTTVPVCASYDSKALIPLLGQGQKKPPAPTGPRNPMGD
jgi:hypothetical protein